MALPGGGMPLGFPGGAGAGMSEQQMQEQRMVKMMQGAMESCIGKSVMAGVAGFALGGAFGLFMASMRYDTPLSSTFPGTPGAAAISDLPFRQQLKLGLKDMARSSYSSAKNFGMIGAIFSGTECCIEGLRAKNDIWNGVIGGCLTGGALARNAGPQAVGIGCVGFAAFSAAIDSYMRMDEDEKRKNVI